MVPSQKVEDGVDGTSELRQVVRMDLEEDAIHVPARQAPIETGERTGLSAFDVHFQEVHPFHGISVEDVVEAARLDLERASARWIGRTADTEVARVPGPRFVLMELQ